MSFFDVSFGISRTGLANVGVTEYDALGAVSVARTEAGVFETGFGGYGRTWTLDPSTVQLVWNQVASGLAAVERIVESDRTLRLWQDRGLDPAFPKVIEENTLGEDYDEDVDTMHKDVIKSGSTTTITRTT